MIYLNELEELCNSQNYEIWEQREVAGSHMGAFRLVRVWAASCSNHQTEVPKDGGAGLCLEYPKGEQKLPYREVYQCQAWHPKIREEILFDLQHLYSTLNGLQTSSWHGQLYFSATLKKQMNNQAAYG